MLCRQHHSVWQPALHLRTCRPPLFPCLLGVLVIRRRRSIHGESATKRVLVVSKNRVQLLHVAHLGHPVCRNSMMNVAIHENNLALHDLLIDGSVPPQWKNVHDSCIRDVLVCHLAWPSGRSWNWSFETRNLRALEVHRLACRCVESAQIRWRTITAQNCIFQGFIPVGR